MITESFSNLQSQILAAMQPSGKKTFEYLQEETKLSDSTLQRELDALISKGTLTFNKSTNLYDWEEELSGNPIILEGNLLLPLTVIKFPDKGKMYVSRGKWYELDINFQLRRIIWNVKLEEKTESTLVDLIKSSIIKTGRKTKIVHLPEYDHLRKKFIPYSPDFKINLDAIGEELTAVTIFFKIPLKKKADDNVYIEHLGFHVKSEISTAELCAELSQKERPKDWTNIKINHIFKFSDFIISQNEIPIKLKEGEYIEFIKVFNNRGNSVTLETWTENVLGTRKKLNSEIMQSNEAFDYIRDIFEGLPKQILLNAGFNYEEVE